MEIDESLPRVWSVGWIGNCSYVHHNTDINDGLGECRVRYLSLALHMLSSNSLSYLEDGKSAGLQIEADFGTSSNEKLD